MNLSKLERPSQGQVFLVLSNLLPLRVTLLIGICIFLYNLGLSNWMHEVLQTCGLGAEHAGYWPSIPTLINILGALFIPRMALPNLRFWILAGLFIITGTSVILLKSYSEPIILISLAL